MGRKRRGKQVEEEEPYTTEEMEEYMNFVCADTENVKDYPRKYGIHYGPRILDYVDQFIYTLKIKITPTKYWDEECMEVLGIGDDVRELFGNIGWNEFLDINKPTYKELTMEVLSTLELFLDKDGAPSSISFRLGNQDRRLSANELNHIFQTPENIGTERYLSLQQFDCNEMWREIARRNSDEEPEFNPDHSKASRIRNPVFRYVHRVMANIVFARVEVGSIRKEELHLMYSMMHRRPANMALYLMNQLYRQCVTPVTKCQIGGLITHIADHFGSTHHLQFPPVAGDMRLDLKTLRRMKFVEKINNNYCLVIESENPFPLPNTHLTTWRGRNRGNWDLLSEAHNNWRNDFQEMRVQQQVATRPLIHSTYQRRDPEITRLTRRIEGLTTPVEGLTTQVSGLAAAQTQIVERQTQADEYLQEILNRQRIMFDWHVNEGHFPPYHPPQ